MKTVLKRLLALIAACGMAMLSWGAPVAQWTNFTGLQNVGGTLTYGEGDSAYTLTMQGGSVDNDGVYTVGGGGLTLTAPSSALSVLLDCELSNATGALISVKLGNDSAKNYVWLEWTGANAEKRLKQRWNTNDTDYGTSVAFSTNPQKILFAYNKTDTAPKGSRTFVNGLPVVANSDSLKSNSTLYEIRIGAKGLETEDPVLTDAKIKAIYLYDTKLTEWPTEDVAIPESEPGVIAVQFRDGTNDDITGATDYNNGDGQLGFISGNKGGQIAAKQWNRTVTSSGTASTAVMDTNGNVYEFTYNSRGTHRDGDTSVARDTMIQRLTNGYMDNNGTSSFSLSNLPTTGYDLAIIGSGDGDNDLSKYTVNQEDYTCVDGDGNAANGEEKTVFGSSSWGLRRRASALTEGTNVMYIPGLSASNISVSAPDNNGRGTTSAIMVFPRTIATASFTATDGNVNYSDITWTGYEEGKTTAGQITLADGDTLTFDTTPSNLVRLNVVCSGNCTIAFDENQTLGTIAIVDTTGIEGNLTYQYNYATDSVVSGNIYTAGAGSTDAAASMTMNGGTLELTGGTFCLPSDTGVSGTSTTINQSGSAKVVTSQFALGEATWTMSGTSTMETERFILSQGQAGRHAQFILKDSASVKVTGINNSNNNTASILFGHYDGSSTFTIQDSATFEAASQVLVGLTDNTHVININGGTFTAPGIKVSYANNGAAGTCTLNLAGGELKLGTVGIDSYTTATPLTVNVTGNATITSTAEMSITQPIVLNEGKVLTLDATGGTITLTGAVGGSGAIYIDGGTVDMTALTTLPTIAGVASSATLKVKTSTSGLNLKLAGAKPSVIFPVADGVTTDDFAGDIKITYTDLGSDPATTETTATVTITNGQATAAAPAVTGNAAITGSMWLWDYEFNNNNASIGSNTGTLSYEGSADSYLDLGNNNYALYFQKTPYRSASYGTAYTAVMCCIAGSNITTAEDGTKTDAYANKALIGFGTAGGKAIILATGTYPADGDMQLLYWNGTSAEQIGGVLNVSNATTAYHTYVFTLSVKDGNTTISVYVDGKLKAAPVFTGTISLGSGFQIGSVHGGVVGGVTKYPDSGNSGTLDFLRTVNETLTPEAIKAIAVEYPYQSKNGLATRTVTTADTKWVASSGTPWTQNKPSATDGTGGKTNEPQAAPDNHTMVTLTANGDATLAMNVTEDTSYETLTVEGTGAVTLTAGEHHVTASDLTVETGIALTVDPEQFAISTATVETGATLTFDIAHLLAKNPFETQVVTLTGVADVKGTLATFPATDGTHNRTISIAQAEDKTITLTIAPSTKGYTATLNAGNNDLSGLTYTENATASDHLLTLVANETATLNMDEDFTVSTLTVDGTGVITVSGQETLSYETLTLPTGKSLTVDVASGVTWDSGNVTGTGTLTKTGAGTMRFNTSGKTNKKFVDGTTVRVLNGALNLNGGDGDVELNNATLSFGKENDGAAPSLTNHGWVKIPGDGFTVHVDENVTVNSSVVFWNDSPMTKTGAGTFNFALNSNSSSYSSQATTISAGVLGVNGTATLSGVISGTGALHVNGGTVTLSAANTYSGGTTVNGGTLKLAGTAANTVVIKEASTITVESGATLELVKGLSFIGVEGNGVTKVSGSEYTFGLGNTSGSTAGLNLRTKLVVDDEQTFTVRSFQDGGLTPLDVEVNGTIQRDSANGNNLKVTIPKMKALKGDGTISGAVVFAEGSVLDTTGGAPTISGDITFNNNLTVKVASDATFPLPILVKSDLAVPTTSYTVEIDGVVSKTHGIVQTADAAGLSVDSDVVSAWVDNKPYTTLAAAVTAALADDNTGRVELSAASSDAITINEGQTLTLVAGEGFTEQAPLILAGIVTNNGTLKTQGALTLSAANVSKGTLDVESGTLTLTSGSDSLEGNIIIRYGATLANQTSWCMTSGITHVKVYGTLSMGDTAWGLNEKSTLTLGAGATVSGGDNGTSGKTIALGGLLFVEDNPVSNDKVVHYNAMLSLETKVEGATPGSYDTVVKTAVEIPEGVTVEFTKVIRGNADDNGFAFSGAGIAKLTATNTYSGGTTIGEGATVEVATLANLGGSGAPVAVTGTLKLVSASASLNEVADDNNVDYSKVTGTGTIWFLNGANENNYWRTLPKDVDKRFATTLTLRNDQKDGLIVTKPNETTEIGSLEGSKPFRADWTDNNRILRIIQSKNTEHTGNLLTSAGRFSKIQVAGANNVQEKTLTLSGTTTTAKPLEIEATGSVNLTGSWSGAVIANGQIAGDGTVGGGLTFGVNAKLIVPSTSVALTVNGSTSYPGTDATAIQIVLSDAPVIDKVILKGANLHTPICYKFVQADDTPYETELKLTVSDGALKIVEAVNAPTFAFSANGAGYDSLTDAISAAGATGTVTIMANCTVDTLDLSSGVQLVIAEGATLTVTNLILGENRDFMGEATKDKLIVAAGGTVSIKESDNESTPIPVTWSWADAEDVTITIDALEEDNDQSTGNGVTIDADGNISYATTLHGKGAWYEYLFEKTVVSTDEATGESTETLVGTLESSGRVTDSLGNDATDATGPVIYDDVVAGRKAMRIVPAYGYTEPTYPTTAWAATFFGLVPNVPGGILISFGTKNGGTITLAHGEGDQVLLVRTIAGASGNETEDQWFELASMDVPNATTAYHLYTFVKTDTGITVYLDGNEWSTYAWKNESEKAIGNGLQIGSIHGGYGQDANGNSYNQYLNGTTSEGKAFQVGRAADLLTAFNDADQDTTNDLTANNAAIDMLRLYDCDLDDYEVGRTAAIYKYESPNGSYTRTVDAATVDWVATETITNEEGEEETVGVWAMGVERFANPNLGQVKLTTKRDVSVMINLVAEADTDNTLEGLNLIGYSSDETGKITFKGATGTKHLTVSGMTAVNVDTEIDCSIMTLGGPVRVAAGKTLTLKMPDTLVNDWKQMYCENGVTQSHRLTGVVTLADGATITPSYTALSDGWVLEVALSSTDNCWHATLSHHPWFVEVNGETVTWKTGADAESATEVSAPTDLCHSPVTVTATADGTLVLPSNASAITVNGTGNVTLSGTAMIDALTLGANATVVLSDTTIVSARPTLGTGATIVLGTGGNAPETLPLTVANFPTSGTVGLNYETVTLSEALSGSWNLSIEGGTTTLTAANGDFGGTITVKDGATLTNSGNTNYNPFCGNTGSLVVNGTLELNPGVSDAHVWVPISGTGKVWVKKTSYIEGAMTLSGELVIESGATLQGVTTVNGASIVCNGTLQTASGDGNGVTIVSGKSLSGAGTVSAPTTFSEGAILVPSSVEVTGEVTWSGAVNVTVPSAPEAGTSTTLLTGAKVTIPASYTITQTTESAVELILSLQEGVLVVTQKPAMADGEGGIFTPPADGDPTDENAGTITVTVPTVPEQGGDGSESSQSSIISQAVVDALVTAAAKENVVTITEVKVVPLGGAVASGAVEDTVAGGLAATEVFENVVTVTRDEATPTQGTATIAYAFGIDTLTVKLLTDSNGDNVRHVVLKAKVSNHLTANTADYAKDTAITVTATVPAVAADATAPTVLFDGMTDTELEEMGVSPLAGEMWFKAPMDDLTALGTYLFTIKAEK